MSHQCPAPYCVRMIPKDQYACKQHWFMLPRDLRDRISQEYPQSPESYTCLDATGEAERLLRTRTR